MWQEPHTGTAAHTSFNLFVGLRWTVGANMCLSVTNGHNTATTLSTPQPPKVCDCLSPCRVRVYIVLGVNISISV